MAVFRGGPVRALHGILLSAAGSRHDRGGRQAYIDAEPPSGHVDELHLGSDSVGYLPTWIEISLTAGCFAAFGLLYVLFSKLFPIVSIWEIKEGRELSVKEVSERVASYLPDDVRAESS